MDTALLNGRTVTMLPASVEAFADALAHPLDLWEETATDRTRLSARGLEAPPRLRPNGTRYFFRSGDRV